LMSRSIAAADDLCIDASNGTAPTFRTPLIILRGFSLPGKNKCKQAQGVLYGIASAVSGSACASSDGSHVTLSLVASTLAEKTGPTDLLGASTIYGVRIYPSTLSGGVIWDSLNGTQVGSNAILYQCKKAYPQNF